MKKILLTTLTALSLFIFSTLSFAETAWIDVRTVEEYNENHIDGDTNIPLATIDIAALAIMYSKDDEINLYCRSGNRAGQAKKLLEDAGFTNVNNVGGIDDVRELRDLAVSSPVE